MTLVKEHSICFVCPFAYPLLVGNGSGPGGAERQFFLFAHEIAKRDWRVSFITEKPTQKFAGQPTSLPVFPASFAYLGGSNLHIPFGWLSLQLAMKKANSNYYVLKVPGHLLAPMNIFCGLYRRRLVFWAQMTHDSNPNERKFNCIASCLQDWGVKRADIVISQSNDQQIGFKKNYGIESIIVPSICERLSLPNSIEVKINTVDKKSDVLWVGNSSEKKRQEVFFELAKLLPDRTFAIAMNKSDDERFAEAAKEAEKLPNVTFLGTVPPVEMERWFQKTKLFLNTSIREGFPNTFLQAWMNGVPVVSLNIDPDEVIKKFNLGRVVGIESVSACNENAVEMAALLVPQVQELLAENALREDIGDRARHYIKKHHTPDVVIPELLRLLT